MLPFMVPPSGFGRQLSAEDWIQAGFAVLAEGGPAALRIGRLCEQLAVTKGSFYWHFTDMAEYRSALTGAWGRLHDERRRRFDQIHEPDPAVRLAAIVRSVVEPEQSALEHAMRVWALTDDTVRDVVQRSDRHVLCALRQTFFDAGFGEDEAGVRAATVFAACVGLWYGAGFAYDDETALHERVAALMIRR
jgi:AcrR family transcriptional regulator